MVLLARGTSVTLAAPVPPVWKDGSERSGRETAGLADADVLQQQTGALSAEGVCERERQSFDFVFLPVVPLPRVCDL